MSTPNDDARASMSPLEHLDTHHFEDHTLEPQAPEHDPTKLQFADPSELETFGKPSPEASAKADEEGKKLAEAVQKMTAQAIVPPSQTEVPSWFPVEMLPKADAAGNPFRFPRGRDLLFLHIKAEWMDDKRQDVYLICWPISYGDQQFAVRRAQGDGNRVTDEMTKQMIRVINGRVSDWGAGTEFSPDVLWQKAGQKVRNLLIRMYLQLNTLSSQETRDFFEHCVAVVRTG